MGSWRLSLQDFLVLRSGNTREFITDSWKKLEQKMYCQKKFTDYVITKHGVVMLIKYDIISVGHIKVLKTSQFPFPKIETAFSIIFALH